MAEDLFSKLLHHRNWFVYSISIHWCSLLWCYVRNTVSHVAMAKDIPKIRTCESLQQLCQGFYNSNFTPIHVMFDNKVILKRDEGFDFEPYYCWMRYGNLQFVFTHLTIL